MNYDFRRFRASFIFQHGSCDSYDRGMLWHKEKSTAAALTAYGYVRNTLFPEELPYAALWMPSPI